MSNSQSSERPDLQDLVAYMQGRGSEALRAQVLKRLDEDESYLELMMDLVPMLREAGELADPDAAPAAPPALRPLVSPIAAAVDAPLPPAAAPPAEAPARVVPFPESPSRRRTAAISLMAAMIPAAVAIFIATRPPQSPDAIVAAKLPNIPAAQLDEPWIPDVTRSAEKLSETCLEVREACFDAGAQMVDLNLALKQEDSSRANALLQSLRNSLGEPLFEQYFPGLAPLPEGKSYDLASLKKPIRAGQRALLKDLEVMDGFTEGVCFRGAVLAARTQHQNFFTDRHTRKLCMEMVGETNWKADAKALATLYGDKRFDLSTGH